MLTEPQLRELLQSQRRKHDSNVFIALLLNSDYSVVSDNQNHVRLYDDQQQKATENLRLHGWQQNAAHVTKN